MHTLRWLERCFLHMFLSIGDGGFQCLLLGPYGLKLGCVPFVCGSSCIIVTPDYRLHGHVL